MGMFDYVNFECNCPKCGQKITEFQTKERGCTMSTLEYWETPYFYGSCYSCKIHIDVNLKPGKSPFIPIDDYEIKFNEL